MPQRTAHRFLLAAIAVCAMAGDAAWAARHDGGRDGPHAPYAGGDQVAYQQPGVYGYPGSYAGDPRDNGLPASVRRIQRATGGQVLRAQPYERDGREVYRVKVLTPQGRIRVYEDDPGAGREDRGGPQPVYPRQAPPPQPSPVRDHGPQYQYQRGQPPVFQPPYQPQRNRRRTG